METTRYRWQFTGMNQEMHQAYTNATSLEKAMEQLINKDQRVINENANKDANVFNTQRDLTAGSVAKAVGLKMMPKSVAFAHLKGDIHFHDLDYSPYMPMTNCCLVDIEGMLKNGFEIGNAKVESPKSIQTAAALVSQVIANVASSQFGGTSIDRIDEVLAPYAEISYQKHFKKAQKWIEDPAKQEAYAKELTAKEIHDACQSMEYEVNTLYTSNGQTPFVTFGFGLGTSWYAREIQKAMLEIRIAGLGKDKRTAIFPKLVFILQDGINLKSEDPNYDIKQLAVECSTKRMYPDVISAKVLTEITGDVKTSMGCRSFPQKWVDPETGKAVNAGRMNLGVVTLNLPRIALESKGDKDLFWEILEERLSIAKTALLYRIKRVKEAKPENAPILYEFGAFGKRLKDGEDVDQLFNHRRATISLGYIGLYEVGSVFFGPDWESDETARQFTLDVMKNLKAHTDAWGDEYGYHFSVYGTPSESLTDRFCRLDKAKFGAIEGITDKGYYNNSFHLDVRKDWTPFEKLNFEAPYSHYSTGGFIQYAEYPNIKQNPKALEAVWDFAYDYVGYLGTNAVIDHCYECGFDGEFKATAKGFECPECGNRNPDTCDVVKRTCGYLGNPMKRPYIEGRQKEINARVKNMHGSSLVDADQHRLARIKIENQEGETFDHKG